MRSRILPISPIFHRLLTYLLSHLALIVAGLVLGGYATLITITLLKPSKAVEEPVVAAKPAADTTGAMPSIDDAEFAEFIENEANLNKWIDSAE